MKKIALLFALIGTLLGSCSEVRKAVKEDCNLAECSCLEKCICSELCACACNAKKIDNAAKQEF